eukprot:gene10757-7484_t
MVVIFKEVQYNFIKISFAMTTHRQNRKKRKVPFKIFYRWINRISSCGRNKSIASKELVPPNSNFETSSMTPEHFLLFADTEKK